MIRSCFQSEPSCRQEGFTLIELLSVIAIVGLLAVGLVTVINPIEQIHKSQDAKRKSDLNAVQKALELYYQDNGRYPDSSALGRIIGTSGDIPWGNSGFAPYMQVLPKDPGSGQYFYSSAGQSFYLFASLDRGSKDPQACKNTPCLHAGSASCGSGKVCNFGVSSPNVSPDFN
jgi:general secretion pathway protein G